MGQGPTLRALVCDDDPLLRSVLTALLRDGGFRVIGEADSVAEAQSLIERHHVDVLILDLALKGSNGEELLGWLTEHHPHVRTAVFSSFVEDNNDLVDRGAQAVFQKPGFEPLEQWLVELVEAGPEESTSPAGVERRRPPQPAPPLPDRGTVSPSGLIPWTGFLEALDRLWPGDAILALDVLGHRSIADCGDPRVLADHRSAIARLVSPTLRPLDRIAAAPSGVMVALLVAGHPEAAAAVFDRLELAWDRAGMREVAIGAFARVRAEQTPEATLRRVLVALHDEGTTADHPLRLA